MYYKPADDSMLIFVKPSRLLHEVSFKVTYLTDYNQIQL